MSYTAVSRDERLVYQYSTPYISALTSVSRKVTVAGDSARRGPCLRAATCAARMAGSNAVRCTGSRCGRGRGRSESNGGGNGHGRLLRQRRRRRLLLLHQHLLLRPLAQPKDFCSRGRGEAELERNLLLRQAVAPEVREVVVQHPGRTSRKPLLLLLVGLRLARHLSLRPRVTRG
jgi:hypothetical protein